VPLCFFYFDNFNHSLINNRFQSIIVIHRFHGFFYTFQKLRNKAKSIGNNVFSYKFVKKI
jgi:hypothetical protein